MAQPSVAREPSMEEILASIRRIIENNEPDPARAGADAQPAFNDYDEEPEADPHQESPQVEEEEIHLTIEDELPSFAASPAPRPITPQPQTPPQPQAQMRAPAAPAETAPAPARRDAEPRSISLADVAARVRAASERIPAEPPRVAAGEPSASQSRSVELRAAPAPARPVAEAAPRPAPVQQSPIRSDMELRPSRPLSEPAAAVQPAAPTAPRSAEAELASLAANDRSVHEQPARSIEPLEAFAAIERVQHEPVQFELEETKALVSAETGHQVARSFGELAEMMETTARRSLDEVAEELLRPMLQEWLDDNLPTLVERLVREEIERVARGPRR